MVGTGARGRKCWRDTPESTTDPQARLYKKSLAAEAKPSYRGQGIIEARRPLPEPAKRVIWLFGGRAAVCRRRGFGALRKLKAAE